MIYLLSLIIYIIGLAVYNTLLFIAWLVFVLTRLLTSVMETHRTPLAEASKAEWDRLFSSERIVVRSEGQDEELPRCTCSDPGHCHIWCISKYRYTKAQDS